MMFFSNRVSSSTDKSMCSPSPSSLLLSSITAGATTDRATATSKKSRSARIYQRIFSRNGNSSARRSIETTTPCLSTSTSASSFRSSFSISKKMSSETQASKTSEFESLIVDHPSRTVRVSLTPTCAA